MLNEMVFTILVFMAGLALGTFFFGGLWLTIKIMQITKMPSLVFLASFVLRIGIVLNGFYFIAATHWSNMLICLMGFIIARFVVTHSNTGRTGRKGIYTMKKEGL